MDSFKKIMAQTDLGKKDKYIDGEDNPLLKSADTPKNLADYKKIEPKARIYAKLDALIQKAVKKIRNQEQVDETQLDEME